MAASPAPTAAPSSSAAPAGGAAPPSGPRPAGDRPRRSLSPSRAGDFQQCPLLYRYRVIDQIPEPPSSAATRGTLVHAVLERLFDLPAEQRTPASAAELLPGQWSALRERSPGVESLFADDGSGAAVPDERTWLASASSLLDTWFGLEDPTRLEPAERELRLEVALESGLVLRGYVDRLDVSPDGLVRVVDYKTGRAPGEGFEGRALFQMRFYALALWRSRGVVPTLLQLVYLGDGQVVRWSPTEADLEATERKVHALWAAIEKATETGDWRPRRSKLCGWCAHQVRCPEFGGAPPPLPG